MLRSRSPEPAGEYAIVRPVAVAGRPDADSGEGTVWRALCEQMSIIYCGCFVSPVGQLAIRILRYPVYTTVCSGGLQQDWEHTYDISGK